jgi:hypothetical protein
MRAIAAVLALLMTAPAASAAWFAHLDSAGKLMIVGVSQDPDGVSSALTLTCADQKFTIDVTTRNVGKPEDLPSYEGAKIILGYKTRDGEQQKLGLDGKPVILPGDVLAIQSTLTVDQTQAVYQSIGGGYRLDVELVQPELQTDIGVKKFYAEGFTVALMAIHDHCQGMEAD